MRHSEQKMQDKKTLRTFVHAKSFSILFFTPFARLKNNFKRYD